MKRILLLLFLFIYLFFHSQNNEIPTKKDLLLVTENTCLYGTNLALSDFKKGIYNSFSYGLLIEMSPKLDIGLNEFYKDYMFKKYRINMQHKGCEVGYAEQCYAETMNKLILEKFGSKVFKRGKKTAKKYLKEK